jgi:hypothetical protein
MICTIPRWHTRQNVSPGRAEPMQVFRPGAEELRIGWLLSED